MPGLNEDSASLDAVVVWHMLLHLAKELPALGANGSALGHNASSLATWQSQDQCLEQD
jgi:hypothetical protein